MDRMRQVGHARLTPEQVRGNVEYKLKLTAEKGSPRFEELVTQLNWRMRECADDDEACAEVMDLGHYREAIYRVGVADNGELVGLDEDELALSLQTLQDMAACIPAVATVVSQKAGIPPGNRTAVTVLIRASRSNSLAASESAPGGLPWQEVRVCTVGNVDSGKSTLLGVLTRGLRDDGRGRARTSVFRHQHELASGRTSSIANLLLGFDETGHVVNYEEDSAGSFRSDEPEHRARLADAQAMVVERSSKLITFSDLCGHEKYFKTTLMGLVGLNPDYLLCTIDANRGEMRGMVHEHLVVANALSIPTMICMTKVDMAKQESADSALTDVKRFLKQMDSRPFIVRDRQDAVLAAERILQGYIPVFQCSAVTGTLIPEIKLLLNLLVKRTGLSASDAQQGPTTEDGVNLLVMIEDVFPSVPGAGLVVCGRVVRGNIVVGDTVRLGPIGGDGTAGVAKDGFVEARISSMRFENVPTKRLAAGTVGTFALRLAGKVKTFLGERAGLLRPGKVLLGKASMLSAAEWLKANVTILQHPSSIRIGYEPVLHVGMVRQSARVISMRDIETGEDVETLRAGDTAQVLFRWTCRPEVVEVGSALIFRENLVKGIGSVTWVGKPEESDGPKVALEPAAKIAGTGRQKRKDRAPKKASEKSPNNPNSNKKDETKARSKVSKKALKKVAKAGAAAASIGQPDSSLGEASSSTTPGSGGKSKVGSDSAGRKSKGGRKPKRGR